MAMVERAEPVEQGSPEKPTGRRPLVEPRERGARMEPIGRWAEVELGAPKDKAEPGTPQSGHNLCQGITGYQNPQGGSGLHGRADGGAEGRQRRQSRGNCWLQGSMQEWKTGRVSQLSDGQSW